MNSLNACLCFVVDGWLADTSFVAPLCQVAAELFKSRLVRRRRRRRRVKFKGKGQSQKRFSNVFFFFWHEASLG